MFSRPLRGQLRALPTRGVRARKRALHGDVCTSLSLLFGLSCRHCHAVGFLLPRTLSSTCIRLGGCGDVAMVWVSSDLYSSSVFRLLTWYRPVSARSEQCGTEADMRAGAAHKRDVLPHSISGLRSIRWLAPWAPARAVVIGWAQRLARRTVAQRPPTAWPGG